MKLLLCSHGAGPYGAERVLVALGRGLADRRHQVTVELPHDGPAVQAARSAGLDLWISGRPRLPRNTVEGLRFFAGFPAAVTRLARGIRTRSPDLVWASSLYALPAVLAARRAHVPAVWHLHERNLRGPLGLLAALAVRALPAAAVAVSAYVRQSFARGGAGHMHVLHNPLLRAPEPVLDARPEDGGPFRLVCIGQLEPRKRVTDAIAATAEVDDVELWVVGDGKARGKVASAVRRSGAADRIRLEGYQADVAAYLGRVDAVVLPALREPFGLVALEAMAAGVPVIAAKSGAHEEVLGEAAVYYSPGDIRALAGAIQMLRQDRLTAGALVEAGIERVPRFDVESWLDAAERLARRVANPEHPDAMDGSLS